jgi:uncharacterized membrane protein
MCVWFFESVLQIKLLSTISRTVVKPMRDVAQLSYDAVCSVTRRFASDGATMASPASIKNHPIHPMLVGLPIGLWVFALFCDVMRAATGNPVWQTVAIYCIGGGIVGAVMAAVPGLIDYFSIDEAAMKRIANFHLALNLGAVIIFAINLWLRFRLPAESYLPLGMSLVGVLAIGIGGWLGGEMVYVKGMVVEAVEKLAKKVEKSPKRRAA